MVRLVWVFGDRDVLMLLRKPLLAEVVLRRHKVLVLAPELTIADQSALAACGIESGPLEIQARGFNPLARLTARRRLAQTLRAWRASAVIVEDGENLDMAVRAAAQAGVAGIYPLLPSLESGRGPDGTDVARKVASIIAPKVSWRYALGLASAVFVPTPNDERLLAPTLTKFSVPYYQMPPTCLDLQRAGAEALPAIDAGFVFLGLGGMAVDAATPTFADAAAVFDDRGSQARFRLIDIEPSSLQHVMAAGPRLEVVGVARRQDVMIALEAQVKATHVVVIDQVSAQHTLLLAMALALGRPILVVDDAAYRDFVDVGVNGWLVPRGDADALVVAMTAILKRPDLLPGMARASRQKAVRRLDHSLAVQALFKVLGIADLRVQAA